MTVGSRHPAFGQGRAVPFGEIGLAEHRQFSQVFLLPYLLAIQTIQCVQQRVDGENEEEAEPKHNPACRHESAFTLRHLAPAFSETLRHGFSTVTVIRNTT